MQTDGDKVFSAPKHPLLRQFVLFGLIPLIAIAVATRQLYLSKTDTLSTWKGGGMGMFASADGLDTRVLRIWMGPQDNVKLFILGLTSAQKKMKSKAVLYPSWERLEPLARSLQHSKFVGPRKPSQILKADSTGKNFAPTGKETFLLNATGPRPATDPLNWAARIEYWRIRYDPITRKAKMHLVETYDYPPEDL